MTDDATTESHSDEPDHRDDERRREIVTALVVLKSAADPVERARVAAQPPSTATLHALRPADDDIAVATAGFGRLGFDVGPFLGNSMSISGRLDRFEELFGVRFEGGGGVWSLADPSAPARETADNRTDEELPLDPLHQVDARLAACVERILLEPPMDLHEELTWDP